MRKSRPVFMDGDKQILKRQGWEDPSEQEAEAMNDFKADLAGNAPLDPYQRVQAEALDGIHHGGRYGKGYLRAPGGRGYLGAPGGGSKEGGFFPLLAGLASMIIPSLLGSGKNKIGGMIQMRRPLALTNAHSFYKSIADDAMTQLPPSIVHEKMNKLFGSGWKQYYNQKDGGAIIDNLKMGHLLMPLVRGHLIKALSGTGINPESFMEKIESMNQSELDKLVTPDVLQHGGSILGSLWSGVKNFFGKIFTNPKVRNIAGKTISKIGDVAEKQLPKLAEQGAEKLAEYASKKLKGPEPEVKKSARRRNRERDYDIKDMYNEDETPSRRSNRYDDDEEEDERPYRMPKADLPSGTSDSARRKAEVERRKEKRVISTPTKPSYTPSVREPGMRWIKDDEMGNPVWGWGKKKVGGSWTVKLTRN